MLVFRDFLSDENIGLFGKTIKLELAKKAHTGVLIFVLMIAVFGTCASCAYLPTLGGILHRDPESARGGKNSPLPAMQLPETGVVLDVYIIRIPYDRRELLEQFWNDTEEGEIPIETRNALYHHGLRQGMLSAKLPVSLARLLELRDIPPQKPFEKVLTADNLAGGEILHKCKTIPMMHKQPVDFPTFNPIPKLPVLALVDGRPSGQVYIDAEGSILISTEEQPDGSVIVKTIPEIHYGEEKGKTTSVGGEWRRAVYKPKISFDQLMVETKLLLGQWVVIGPENRNSSGFGRDILSQNKGTQEDLLIAIRLKQTRKDGIHDRNDIVLNASNEIRLPQRRDDDDLETLSNNMPVSLADQELGKNHTSQTTNTLFD